MSDADKPSEARDRTTAAALQIAHQELLRRGWAFSVADVVKTARKIVDSFDKPDSTSS